MQTKTNPTLYTGAGYRDLEGKERALVLAKMHVRCRSCGLILRCGPKLLARHDAACDGLKGLIVRLGPHGSAVALYPDSPLPPAGPISTALPQGAK